MLLSLTLLVVGAANARDYTCGAGEDFDDLNLAFAALSAAAGPNTLSIVRDDCIPSALNTVVMVDVDISCAIGSGCFLPPLRVNGGGHLGLSGVTFSTTEAFYLEEYDENRALFPGYDYVYASLYADTTELWLHDSTFTSPDASFGGVVALDCDTTLDGVSFESPNGHAMKLYADDLDVTLALGDVEVNGAGDSALRVLDGEDGFGQGTVLDLSITGSQFSNNSAYYGADLEVFIDGAISVSDTRFTNSVAYAAGAPVEVFASSVSMRAVTFDGTYGGYVGTFWLGANTASLSGLTVTGVSPAAYVAYVVGLSSADVSDSDIALDGQLYVAGGDANFTGNTFLLATGAAPDSGVRLDTTSASFRRNRFCGSGAVENEFGLISGPTTLSFEENVFHSLDLLGPLVDSRSDDDVTASAQGASFLDNTFVNVNAANLMAGDVYAFTFLNNLLVDSTTGFDSAGWRGGTTADYNAWSFTDGSATASPDGWGTHDIVDEAPLFVESYDPDTCRSLPALLAGSPMIDHGSPSRYSGDGSRSDIGAVDYGDESTWDSGATPDTGDDGEDSDRDGDGWADDEDCGPAKPSIHPEALDVPDDGVDQDCDGVEASTAYTGGCGCDASSGAAIPSFLGLAVLVSRKRRRNIP